MSETNCNISDAFETGNKVFERASETFHGRSLDVPEVNCESWSMSETNFNPSGLLGVCQKPTSSLRVCFKQVLTPRTVGMLAVA